MSSTHLLLHVLAIAHGVAASLVCFCLLYLAGFGLTPRHRAELLGRGGHPAVCGAALYVFMCWYGLRLGIRLTPVAVTFAAVSLVLAVFRGRRIVGRPSEWVVRGRAGARWLALFAGLYVLAYVLTLPSVTGEYLPVAWTGNIDLLIYLDYTSYLQRLGPAQPTDLYLAAKDYVYFQTPGVFHLLGGFSVLFGGDPMRAAMPAQFALTALTGVVIAAIARRVFGVSALAAVVVAAITVSGPFFRYIAANYFLSTLMALPVLLHFLLATATHRSARGTLDPALALSCAAHEVLLFFVYPFLFLIALMFQSAVVALAAIGGFQDVHDGRENQQCAGVVREAARTAIALLAGLVAVVALAPVQAGHVLRMMRDLSRPGVWGWALDVISPWALLAFPGATGQLQVKSPAFRPWALAGLCLVAFVLAASFFWWFRRRTTRQQRIFAGLSCLGFLGYAGYAAMVGPSYRQWKMASYLVLPLSFVALAGALRLVGDRMAFVLAARPVAARRVTTIGLVLAGVGFIGGNLLVHALHDPRLHRIKGEMRNLATIEALSSGRDLSIATRDRGTALLAAYYLPRKRLHVFGPQFYPPVSFEGISPARPLLVPDYSCDGVGHADARTIDGVGCLLFAPPSLSLDTVYPFSRSFLFVALRGMGVREGWGRWNGGSSVQVTLTADPRRVRLDRDAGYLNLLLQPRLVPGLREQRLRIAWGTGRQAEARLGERRWISLPLDRSDWSGEWLATQVVSFELPDVLGPHWVDGHLESRPLAVGFLELSLSTSPRGQTVTPLP